MKYSSNKTYGHELGLSAVFRQWRADSHCNQLHGYALSFSFHFICDSLDGRNWVVDFGAMKPVKAWLQEMFDHRLIVAKDDPLFFKPDGEPTKLHRKMIDEGLATITVFDQVGCEAFAKLAADYVSEWILNDYLPEVRAYGIEIPDNLKLFWVEVREHGGNGAKYFAA